MGIDADHQVYDLVGGDFAEPVRCVGRDDNDVAWADLAANPP